MSFFIIIILAYLPLVLLCALSSVPPQDGLWGRQCRQFVLLSWFSCYTWCIPPVLRIYKYNTPLADLLQRQRHCGINLTYSCLIGTCSGRSRPICRISYDLFKLANVINWPCLIVPSKTATKATTPRYLSYHESKISPLNGFVTSQGGLRREAINLAYLQFHELELTRIKWRTLLPWSSGALTSPIK